MRTERGPRRGEARARVLDFGVAKVMSPDELGAEHIDRTSDAFSCLSLSHAAPEQVGRLRTGPWTDVHALALLLVELLVGTRALRGSNSVELFSSITTFGDKVLQRAVAMVLEAVYEQDFLPCSFGFRPGRSAHGALDALRDGVRAMGGAWVLEVDLRKFFDTLEHHHIRDMLSQRVRDGVITRLVGKWLNAGVMESGSVSHPEEGTPQGGVISPLLANIYLHVALDRWFASEVQPRLHGRSKLVRYADDFVIVFEDESDARRVRGGSAQAHGALWVDPAPGEDPAGVDRARAIS